METGHFFAPASATTVPGLALFFVVMRVASPAPGNANEPAPAQAKE
jgi:hypothetical protein